MTQLYVPSTVKPMAGAVAAAMLSFAAPSAYADFNLDTTEVYATPINEAKFQNIAESQAIDKLNDAILADAVGRLTFTDAAADRAVLAQAVSEMKVLKSGDSFTLYNTRGSVVGSTVATEPRVLLGSGSSAVGLDATPQETMTFITGNGTSKTVDLAGKTVDGVVMVGNQTESRRISGVSAGKVSATSTDAVNGSQLHAIVDTMNQGTKLAAQDGNSITLYAGGTNNVSGDGKNVTTSVNGAGDLVVSVKDDVTFTSADIGGVDIANGGITNVKPGQVTATSTDAVNGSQLHQTNQNVKANADKIAAGATLTADDGKAAKITIGSGTTNIKGDAKNVATSVNGDGALVVSVKDDVTFKSADIGGVDIANGGITNVKPGQVTATSTDAINGSQLYELSQKTHGATAEDGKAVTAKLGETVKIHGDGANTVTATTEEGVLVVKLKRDIDVDKVTSVQSNIGGVVTKDGGITNLKAGQISATSTDAINGSQVFNLLRDSSSTIQAEDGKTVNLTSGSTTKVVGDGKNVTTSVGENGDFIVAVKDDVKFNSSNVGGVVTQDGGITNLKAGRVTATSTDAVNGSQLYQTNQKVQANADKIAAGATLTADDGKTAKITIGSGTTNIKGDGKNTATSVNGDGALVVGLNPSIEIDAANIGGTTIGVHGINNGGKKITNIAPGEISATSTDAINGSQLHNAMGDVNNRMNKMDKRLSGAVTAAAAVSGIEYVEQRPGDWVVGVGAAHYNDTTALGVGANFLSENGRYKVNVGYGQSFDKGSKPLFKTSFSFSF